VPVKTQEKVRSAVARVGEGLTEKAWTVGRDPRTERKKRLAWAGLRVTFNALAAVGARRIGTKLWGILTGERPPGAR
jgi:hypothetical protein